MSIKRGYIIEIVVKDKITNKINTDRHLFHTYSTQSNLILVFKEAKKMLENKKKYMNDSYYFKDLKHYDISVNVYNEYRRLIKRF